jgi:hypothetical protein
MQSAMPATTKFGFFFVENPRMNQLNIGNTSVVMIVTSVFFFFSLAGIVIL